MWAEPCPVKVGRAAQDPYCRWAEVRPGPEPHMVGQAGVLLPKGLLAFPPTPSPVLKTRFHTSLEPQRKELDCFRPLLKPALLKPALPGLGHRWDTGVAGLRLQRMRADCGGWGG